MLSRVVSPLVMMIIALALVVTATAPALADDGTEGLPADILYTCSLPESSSIEVHVVKVATPQIVVTPATPIVEVDAAFSTPNATPQVLATPAPPTISVDVDALPADLEDAITNILSCMSINSSEELTHLTGPSFRGELLALGEPISDDAFDVLLTFMPVTPYELVSVSNIAFDDNIATVIVDYLHGRQVERAEWTLEPTLIDGRGVWRVQNMTTLPVEAATVSCEITLTISDNDMELAQDLCNGDVVLLHVTNNDIRPHEALVVRSPQAGTKADFVAASPALPTGSTFIGQITILPGETETMVLNGLRPADYQIVDLLPNEQSLPNVSDGLITSFTIEN